MTQIDTQYNRIISEVLSKGRWYKDETREETHRLQIPRTDISFDMSKGFPAITTKELKWNSVITELIWFLSGNSNIKTLVKQRNPIWNKDAYNWYKKACREVDLKPVSLKEFIQAVKDDKQMCELHETFDVEMMLTTGYVLGDVGSNYSKQWRNYGFQGVDQIVDLIKNMRKNIMSTRLKVEAWNPDEVKDTALPPCHTGFQIVGIPLTPAERSEYFKRTGLDIKYGFDLYWNQRSVDTFLGLSFNIASYAALGSFLQEVTGYVFLSGGGDLKCVHLYDNSVEAAKDLLKVENSFKAPELKIDLGELKDAPIEDILERLDRSHFTLVNYESNEAVSVEMKAPKEV